ncbi:putative dehydrogenase [Anseongella ginsenosidimutans]|uniref:Putative dehydrogenase n=1 Tax=Anseongella ginsenosidimutans TaxID=496056 RepID=A0A4R3KN52_9SPHI|nr:Gfo/Idh/MocA family oxidoreductase [Anseongella ginsenosidimutans]QEC52470.1 Gfo/Idh/MocA family oxidoreductase [Anseongella ginsenosidimutans]TCS85352.1 putative dehydrogenase [Anseongella ginsenosidimutans]
MTVDRRSFIKMTSAIAAGGMMVPAFARGAGHLIAPSDRLNMALIGCRNMGWADLSGFLQHKEVRCLALCDIDKNVLASRAKELSELQGQKPDLYGDYRAVLDRKDIDAVIIGTPDHWHCLQFVDSCEAGKDIYVEKPISNSIAGCDAMVSAAEKYNTVIQVGQQQRSGKHWHEMIGYLRSGKLGNIGRVHIWANFNYAAIKSPVPDSGIPEGVDFNTWLGPAPGRTFNKQRFHGSWRMFWDYGGGLITDWGVHLLDMGLWGMDIKAMPQKILSSGGNYLYPEGAHETFDTLSVTYQFPDFMLEWENNAGVETGPYGRNYGVLFRGTNGTLVADRNNWAVYPEKEKIAELTVQADGRDHQNHIRNFLDHVKSRDRNTACTIENGSLCARYAHFGNIGARIGGAALTYDPKKGKFDVSAANKYLQPEYRSPWKFPGRGR